MSATNGIAQDSMPLRVFGYFQNSFAYQTKHSLAPEQNSFDLQQLNVFFQKDISQDWRAFVNFEFVNTYSSLRNWGANNLEEAWLSYRLNPQVNVKFGLLIPVFNHLNVIKNRTPLLPYVVRPLVYESSFGEFIDLDDYVPTRAFVQVYGFIPSGSNKIDYAVYLGNSQNLNNASDRGQTGVDTTDTFLIGTRVGLRVGELKVGASSSFDFVNSLQRFEPLIEDVPLTGLSEVPRLRLGLDLSYYLGRFYLQAETIGVGYDDDTPELSIDRSFYYATVGMQVTESWQAYASYWYTDQDNTITLDEVTGQPEDASELTISNENVYVSTIGASYTLMERLTFKGQGARVRIDYDLPEYDTGFRAKYWYFTAAVSVFF